MVYKTVRDVYRLSKKDKQSLRQYLEGEITQKETAAALGIPHQRLYTLITYLTRQWVQDAHLDAGSLLQDY